MWTSDGPGAAIRAHRRQAQLSQEEFATRAGISVRALRDIEGGRVVREPRGATLRLLMQALELDRAARDALVPWTPVVGPVVAQLPAGVPDFTGRDGLVTGLTAQLRSAPTPLSKRVDSGTRSGSCVYAPTWIWPPFRRLMGTRDDRGPGARLRDPRPCSAARAGRTLQPLIDRLAVSPAAEQISGLNAPAAFGLASSHRRRAA